MKLEISRFLKKQEKGSEVVFFEFTISRASKTWTLEKRFSECYSLFEDLKKSHGDNLPPFPGKTLFVQKSYEQLTSRKQKLEFFFQDIIKRTDLTRDKNTMAFLNLKLDENEAYPNLVKIIGKLGCSFGVRDFVFDIGTFFSFFIRSSKRH